MTNQEEQRAPEITREKLINIITTRPVDIGRACGFTLLGDLHNEWLLKMLYGKRDRTILGHRGSYKTTVLSLFFALHLILKPHESVLYLRKTDADIKEITRQTAKLLHTGLFKLIVSELYDISFRVTRETDTQINTNLNKNIRGAAQLFGLGIGSSITGKHADIICTDDIVNVKDRISKAERENTKIVYQELRNVLNRDGRMLNTGTPWHKNDAISELMGYIEKYDCYTTGLIDKDTLQTLRESMTPSLFAANYELRHIADEQALFKTEPHIMPEDTPDAVIYDGIGHIDAAYGGEDYTAFTCGRETGPGAYTLYGKMYRGHVNTVIDKIMEDCERFRIGTIHCEANADKGYLADEIRRRGGWAQTYHEKQNKYVKIATYLKKAWAKIDWHPDTDPEYLAQIMDYTERAAHDDAADSAASLVRIFEKDAEGGIFGYDI